MIKPNPIAGCFATGDYSQLLARSRYCLVMPGKRFATLSSLGMAMPCLLFSATRHLDSKMPLWPPCTQGPFIIGSLDDQVMPTSPSPLAPTSPTPLPHLFHSHLSGDGWSARAEDAVLHGCVPVVIMDRVHAVWEPQLDWPSFSVRVNESALHTVRDERSEGEGRGMR